MRRIEQIRERMEHQSAVWCSGDDIYEDADQDLKFLLARLERAESLLRTILTDTAQTVPDTFDEIRSFLSEDK